MWLYKVFDLIVSVLYNLETYKKMCFSVKESFNHWYLQKGVLRVFAILGKVISC